MILPNKYFIWLTQVFLIFQTTVAMTETSLWNATSHLVNNMHRIFLTLLKSGPTIKSRLLKWIGKCLKNNVTRGKLWSIQV